TGSRHSVHRTVSIGIVTFQAADSSPGYESRDRRDRALADRPRVPSLRGVPRPRRRAHGSPGTARLRGQPVPGRRHPPRPAARRAGAWVVAVTLAASLVFGLMNHFVRSTPDHVTQVVRGWRPLFAATAVVLALTEAIAAGLAIRLARETAREQ